MHEVQDAHSILWLHFVPVDISVRVNRSADLRETACHSNTFISLGTIAFSHKYAAEFTAFLRNFELNYKSQDWRISVFLCCERPLAAHTQYFHSPLHVQNSNFNPQHRLVSVRVAEFLTHYRVMSNQVIFVSVTRPEKFI